MIGYRYSATCIKVIDGDTVDMQIDLGFHAFVNMRFRLNRINTPELNSKDETERLRAQAAKQFAHDKISAASELEVVSHKTEKYGRYLAEVFYTDANGKEINLNDELLAQGLADKYD